MTVLHRFALALFMVALTASPVLAQAGSFGNSVVIDGDALLVGEPNNTFRPGMVYVYKRGETQSEWTEATIITAPNSDRADGFGAVLALTGNSLLVANREGSVFAFQRDGIGWSFDAMVTEDTSAGIDPRCDFNGYCGVDYGISLAAEGDWVLVGHANVTTDRSRLRPRQRTATDDVPDEPAGEVIA